MKEKIVLALFLLVVGSVHSQTGTELQLLKHVNFLSSDILKDRAAGSEKEREANKYIRENWGDGKRTNFYSWEHEIVREQDTVLSEMVGTFLYNKAKATVLIGAELENAADLAVLIGIQNLLCEMKLDVNVMVVSMTSYQNGHQGLDYLRTHMPKKAKDIRLVIYLNEVGGMDVNNPKLHISATQGIFEELQLLTKQFELSKEEDVELKTGATQPYIANQIQALTVSSKNEGELNTRGMQQIQNFIVDWVVTK